MPRLNDIERGTSIIMLAYGGSGVGKTHFCGSAGSRSLIINIGGGIATLQSKGFRNNNKDYNPFIETISEDAVPTAAKAFDEVCNVIDQYLSKQSGDFDTIIVDDVTALRRFAMNKGLEINQKLGKSKSASTSKMFDIPIVAVQDYGIEMQLMESFTLEYIRLCKEANKHLIMTAHERVSFNTPTSIGGEPTINSIKPGFTGRLFPDAVTGHFDLVWHFEKMGGGEQIKYRARTIGDNNLTAHTKWSGIFSILEPNPNFLDIIKKIKEN